MVLNDLTFALRHLRRNLFVSGINVLGLSIGLSSCLIIFLIVNYEMSFDRFQPDRDRIFRIYTTFPGRDSFHATSGVPTAFAAVIQDHYSSVESVANFRTYPAFVAVDDDHGARKEFGMNLKTIITPPDYFEVFDHYQWIAGTSKTLTEPFHVVLTESRVRTYFGDIDPVNAVGKEIYYYDSLLVTVSGIVRDITENTDLDFTDFISESTVEHSWLNKEIELNSWRHINSNSQLFVKVFAGTVRDKFLAQISELGKMYKDHNLEGRQEITPGIQSLAEVHFDSDIGIFDNSRPVIEMSTLKMLLGVAALLLAIAVINFVNLETAQASRYWKEVGIRKLMGSSRSKLIRRFLMQSFILCALAGILSAGLADLYFTYLTFFTPQGFTFRFIDPDTVIFLVSGVVLVTLMAGLYPAFALSSFQPARALRGARFSNVATGRSVLARRGLTVFQFAFSQILIVGTVIMIKQLNYMLDKDLGFQPEAVVLVRSPSWEHSRLETFKSELMQHPDIKAVTLSSSPPLSTGMGIMPLTLPGESEIIKHDVHTKQGDTSYVNVYGIQLLAGRNLVPYDSAHEFLVNEAFLDVFGIENPPEAVGKILDKGTIVGVVKDFHGQPLWNEIKPTVIRYQPGGVVGIKLLTSNRRVTHVKGVMENIEGSYRNVFPDEEFNYTFLDDQIRQIYANERHFAKVAGMSTGIAILISCLGLFGYFSFTVIQRTKEIGIRKVLGATIASILVLLSKDFLKIVLIALIISVPIAFYATALWLEKFAYKVNVSAGVFLVPAVASVLMCLITIGVRALYAARENPVKTLRYE